MIIISRNLNKLTNGDNYYDYPSPLDDGTILYLSNEGNKWEIWKMNAAHLEIEEYYEHIKDLAISTLYEDDKKHH